MKIKPDQAPILIFGIIFTFWGVLLLFNQFWPSSKYGFTINLGATHWFVGFVVLLLGILSIYSVLRKK